jgi:phage shock protein PspC (stress-responsive transcriptional regulator)
MVEKKKFYRSRTERMIAGVCGGLAAYLGIDPVLVRVLSVVLVPITGGIALLAYILLWLFGPEEPASA